MTTPTRLSGSQARRVALAAQGFADRPPTGVPDRRMLRRVLSRTRVLQIDSVNVLARAHYLPAFSRLGPYPTAVLDAMSQRRPRRLFEYWGHMASLLPVEMQPLFRWRMARQEAWGSVRRLAQERPDFVSGLLEQIRARGPMTAGELARDRPRRNGPWWDWSDEKRAVEWLFMSGQLTTATRRGFERVYDLPERVLPPEILAAPTPSVEDAHRELVRISGRALGVGTEHDLADYFRLPLKEIRPRIQELVEEGSLLPATVEGWGQRAYLDPRARAPRRLEMRTLLCPFDPVVWERGRAERLFGMRYRIEIYVPAPKRVHGYYVLPFLAGEGLVARVDLKADRQAGVLLCQAAHSEVGLLPGEIAEELTPVLASIASWLGLSGVRADGPGDLSPHLRRTLARIA